MWNSRWVLVLIMLLAAGCGSSAAQEQPTSNPDRQASPRDVTLSVFAASSLTDAMIELGQRFEAAHPGVLVAFNFASSSTLAAQLAEGAPADLFASANLRQIEAAQEAGRITDPAEIFARNRLVVAVPKDNPKNIEDMHDLANRGILLVIGAMNVPIRDYTDAVIRDLAARADYGAAWASAVRANVVSEEENVRQVVTKVALGEADAGIVYQSDITPDLSETVTGLKIIPDDVNPLAAYPMAVVSSSEHPELARAFLDFVMSDEGQAIIMRWGFVGVESTE